MHWRRTDTRTEDSNALLYKFGRPWSQLIGNKNNASVSDGHRAHSDPN